MDEKRPDAMVQHTRVVDALQAFRFEAGGPSYAEIAARVTRLRASRVGEGRAVVVARSTVYDIFRPERKRLDADLVADIVLALGGSDRESTELRRRCAQQNAGNRAARPSGSGPERSAGALRMAPAQLSRSAPAAGREKRRAARWRPVVSVVALLVLALVNVAGGQVILWFDLPLFLDMIGTAIAAIVLGPWYGVAVAVLTQVSAGLYHHTTAGIPYTLVGAIGALLWAYGVRRWGFGRSASRFLLLTLVVAVACTAVSAPITVLLYGGFSGHVAADGLTERLVLLGESLGAAVFSANLLTSLLDKLIAGFIALAVGASLIRRLGGVLPPPPAVPLFASADRPEFAPGRPARLAFF